MSSSGIGGLDSSVLLGFYQARLSATPSSIAAAAGQNAALAASQQKNSATAKDDAPWNTPNTNDAKQDAQVLSTTNFLNTSNVPLSAGATTDSKTEQDNQKLFSLYSAVNTLAYIAKMGQKSTATSGQLAGLNDRFQTGLAQVQNYIASTSFNNFTLQAAKPSNQVTSTATVPFSAFTYATKQLVTNTNLNSALPGLSASQSFTITVKKGATNTDVNIDLSQVQGGLTLGNVISYINGQLSAAGVSTRFQKTEQGGTDTSDKNATYGLQITPGGNESISFSATATPALYMVGSTGSASDTNTVTNVATSATTTTPADQTGRLTKLSGIDGSPTGVFSVNQQASTGITNAQKTVVDSSGNIYVIGAATGNFGNQINQGSQDVYLTKYDFAGHQTWSKMLGSAGSASGYGLALDPSGGVVVTGASTADLTTTSVADGNNDSFVARYDSSGNQSWIKQIQTLATNQSNTVTVDASGNVYIGGSVSGGVVGAGQTSQGKGDAYLAKYDSKGKLLAENQFGTTGADSVAATATASDGSLYVASVQNGDAVVAKYASGDITAAPLWTQDLGSLAAGGAIGGLAVSNGQVYVSGTTSNSNLTAGGSASIAAASSGGINSFVFNLTDNGSSASANHVTYVGTSATDQGGAVTVGPDRTVYLAGTTLGTFSGQSRNVQNVNNAFATAIGGNGSIQWTRQFGGQDGQSTGNGLAIDPSGSSVLDALGLPRGTITLDQSVDLTSQTTLRAGDSFQIKIQGATTAATRTTTITIDPGETLDSLSTKINAQLGSIGKASVNYVSNAEGLNIKVNPGNTIQLISGPDDFDALARLGIAPGTLTAPAAKGSANGSATHSTSTAYGLGFSGTLDISTKTGADLARSQLLTVLSSLQSTYQTTNKPAAPPAQPGNTSGTASGYTTSQLANYSLALSMMQGGSGGSSDGTTSLF